MTTQEVIDQLESLREDRLSFITDEEDHDVVFHADIEAIDIAIECLKKGARTDTDEENG